MWDDRAAGLQHGLGQRAQLSGQGADVRHRAAHQEATQGEEAERNGLEKAEKNTAMEVTNMTLTKSSHTALTMGVSNCAPCHHRVTPAPDP